MEIQKRSTYWRKTFTTQLSGGQGYSIVQRSWLQGWLEHRTAYIQFLILFCERSTNPGLAISPFFNAGLCHPTWTAPAVHSWLAAAAQHNLHHLSCSLLQESMPNSIKAYNFGRFSTPVPRTKNIGEVAHVRWDELGAIWTARTRVLTNLPAHSNYCRVQRRCCHSPSACSHSSLASSQISLQEALQSHSSHKKQFGFTMVMDLSSDSPYYLPPCHENTRIGQLQIYPYAFSILLITLLLYRCSHIRQLPPSKEHFLIVNTCEAGHLW